jgi:twinkle protein
MTTTLSERHMEWLAIDRGIDPEIAVRMGIYSVARGADGEAVASAKGNVIAFPFWRRGTEVATKYRTADKRMWQRKGGEKRFFNGDILDDPALADGRGALVITEGEIDALSALTAGYPWSVSVPDGAPPARDAKGNLIVVPEGADDIVPEEDVKFGYIAADWEALVKVQRIVIAVDADEPGERLAAELVRRLGRIRCSRARFPDGCKDLNEVLLKHGSRAVLDSINGAQPYPVSGLYAIDDLPAEPPLDPVTTGWSRLDDKLRVYRPCLMVVSGFANAGKSTWTTQLVANLAVLHGWPCAVASFEMRHGEVVTALERCAAEGLMQHRNVRFRVEAMVAARRLVRSYFTLIAPAPGSDEETDIDWLLERATAAVIRHGSKVLVLDPWNEVEHRRGRDETGSEYTGRMLRKLKRWAAQMEVLVILVVHPTKAAAQKEAADLTLYDVADSAHFANKADLGVMIARLGKTEDSLTGINVVKVRYQPDAGHPGSAELVYDRAERVFGQ